MNRVRSAAVLLVTAMTAVWFAIRFGVDFGVSDQDEFLPYLIHLGNPDWLTSDWFVQSQLASVSVRAAFAWVLHGMTLAGLTTGQAVLALYVLSWLLLGAGIYRLTLAITDDPRAGLLAIPLVLIVTSRWNPGGNDFMYGLLVPESLAWGMVLFGASIWTTARMNRNTAVWASGLLFGLAVWIHPLVGLQSGGVVLVVLLFARFTGTLSWKMIGLWSGLWLALAIPVVWMFLPGSSPADDRASEILVHLRSPHHYLPHAFDPASLMLLLVLVGAAAWVLWSKPAVFRSAFSRQTAALVCWVLTGGLAASAVVVHLWPDGPLTVVQPFKLAVLLRGACVVLVSTGLVAMLSHRLPTIRQCAVVALLLTMLGVALVVSLTPVQQRALPFMRPDRVEFRRLAQVVETHTPANAVVVIPPGWTGFQFASHRAQYVNFKAFPFQSDAVLEWYDRLVAIGAAPEPGQAGTDWLQALSRAYVQRTAGEWQTLLARINATHAIVPESIAPPAPLVCQSGWCLLRAPAPLAP
ncbi:MAG: DUF6798 domain-containing protein [Rhodothermales bacterium]